MIRNVSLLVVGLAIGPVLGGCTVSVYDNPAPSTPARTSAGRTTHRPGGHASTGGKKGSKPSSNTNASAPPANQPAGQPNTNAGRAPAPDLGKPGSTVGRAPPPDLGKPAGRPAPEPIDPKDPPRINGSNAFGNGQGGAFKGIAFAIPKNTQKMPDFGQLRPFATLFRDVFDTLPGEFKAGFPGITRESDWFGIRYEGLVAIPSDGTYRFRMASDDGAILYIDDEKLLDNDGVHLSTNVWQEKAMTKGLHRVRLDYFHTTGLVSLMVWVSKDKGPEMPLVGTKRGLAL